MVDDRADSLPGWVQTEREANGHGSWCRPWENQLEYYVKTKGVMVIGVNSVVDEQGITCNPCENLLSPGDYVMRINGQSVDDKKINAGTGTAKRRTRIAASCLPGK